MKKDVVVIDLASNPGGVDRKVAKEADKKIDLANKQRRIAETKNTELEAKIDRLQAELDYYKALLEDKNE